MGVSWGCAANLCLILATSMDYSRDNTAGLAATVLERLQAMRGRELVALAKRAGVSRATAYRLRRSLSNSTPFGTVERLARALAEPQGD